MEQHLASLLPRPPAGTVNLVAACAENRVIGAEGRLPWSIPGDAALYRSLVDGGVLIHGRRTHELFGAPRGTETIVVTSRPPGSFGQIRVAPSVAAAIALARPLGLPIWVGGGQRIYEAAWPLADRLYLTLIHADVPGDRWLPDWHDRFTVTMFSHAVYLPPLDCTLLVLAATERCR